MVDFLIFQKFCVTRRYEGFHFTFDYLFKNADVLQPKSIFTSKRIDNQFFDPTKTDPQNLCAAF